MPHISLPAGLPGIRGPLAFRPETAKPINGLVNILLHDAHSLSPGERELIATYVSSQNDCYFCQSIHGAVLDVKRDFGQAGISDKRARHAGATGLEIHDTVLIAEGYKASVSK